MKKKIVFFSERSNINIVEQLVDDISEKLEISSEMYGNILVCVVEAARNAIIHGNRLDPNKEVFIEFENSEKEISFTFTDEGRGFDFDDIPDPTAPENLEKPFGRGIFLIKNLSDKTEFFKQGTEIKISFNLNQIN